MVDGLGHVDDPAPAAANAPQVEGVLEGGGLTVLGEPGRERPVGPDEALMDGELDELIDSLIAADQAAKLAKLNEEV